MKTKYMIRNVQKSVNEYPESTYENKSAEMKRIK